MHTGRTTIRDIIGIWDSITEFAQSIGEEPDTVRKWPKAGRIPPEYWQATINAAATRGRTLTVDEILAACSPMKRRGRPAHRKGGAYAHKDASARADRGSAGS